MGLTLRLAMLLRNRSPGEILDSLSLLNRVDNSVESARDNPSRWSIRLPIAGLAFLGLGISSYLAADQFGLLAHVWEPFFGQGSERVLHSFLSRLLPVPDAALGAAGYAVELLAALLGGADRWRTSPKLVLVYGGIVAGLALTGLGLAGVQFFILHAACTLCLTSAALSLLIAWLARDEIWAGWKAYRHSVTL